MSRPCCPRTITPRGPPTWHGPRGTRAVRFAAATSGPTWHGPRDCRAVRAPSARRWRSGPRRRPPRRRICVRRTIGPRGRPIWHGPRDCRAVRAPSVRRWPPSLAARSGRAAGLGRRAGVWRTIRRHARSIWHGPCDCRAARAPSVRRWPPSLADRSGRAAGLGRRAGVDGQLGATPGPFGTARATAVRSARLPCVDARQRTPLVARLHRLPTRQPERTRVHSDAMRRRPGRIGPLVSVIGLVAVAAPPAVAAPVDRAACASGSTSPAPPARLYPPGARWWSSCAWSPPPCARAPAGSNRAYRAALRAQERAIAELRERGLDLRVRARYARVLNAIVVDALPDGVARLAADPAPVEAVFPVRSMRRPGSSPTPCPASPPTCGRAARAPAPARA